jgi:hypothetical protein
MGCCVAKLVTPIRREYSENDLLPTKEKRNFDAQHLHVKNDDGLDILTTFWRFRDHVSPSDACILYLHPKDSARIEVITTGLLDVAKEARMNVASFDFVGCGHRYETPYNFLNINYQPEF